MHKSTPTYGLTGGIASGKSTALDAWRQLGIPTIDADDVARLVIAPGTEGATALKAAIGDQFFTGDMLDRRKLRDAMYLDGHLKQTVESIVHPRVKAHIASWKTEPIDAPYRILCSPLLFETQQDRDLDGVIVIDTDPELQIARAMQRDRRSRAEIAHILANQVSREERLAKASHVLDNSGTADQLKHNVWILHQRLIT